MNVYVHVLLQAAGVAVSYGTLATTIVPDKIKPFVVLAVSAAQGLLAWYNHYYTPSGTKIVS